MLGLFGTINLAQRSLATQQQAIEVVGHNIANVGNSAYARQRANIATSVALPTILGTEGTGAEITAIQQIRNALLDRQVTNENSVTSYWDSQKTALGYAQNALDQQLSSSDANSTSSTSATDTTAGITQSLCDFFNSLQSLANDPASMSERQIAIAKAQSLASRFNNVDQQLSGTRSMLNESIGSDVKSANQLMSDIAKLNHQIMRTEAGASGPANDLRDLRQQKVEELAKLVKVEASEQGNGSVNITVGGALLVSNDQQLDSLQTYDAGAGRLLIRTATGGENLALTGGSIAGTIDARDGALATLQNDINALASHFITQMNTIHATGYSLSGSQNALFFTGSNASDMAVNSVLVNNPKLIQASGTLGASGDNKVALAMADLANQPQATLSGQTFGESYANTVAALGYSLSYATTESSDQQAVQQLLSGQRDSYSGVSLDEEMANLQIYQRAFQASAKLLTTIDEMLQTVVNMK